MLSFLVLLSIFWTYRPISCAEFTQLCAPDGLEVKRNQVFFNCIKGKLEVGGCLDEGGNQIPINKTYLWHEYELRCHRFSDIWAQMMPLACWNRGRQYLPMEIMVEEPFWYTCVSKDGEIAKFQISGCINMGEKSNPNIDDQLSRTRLTPGQSFQKGQYIFTCVKENDTMTIEPTACIFEGDQIPAGAEFTHGLYAYTCNPNDKNDGIELIMSGCIYRGKKYEPGRKYVWNGFIFECYQNGTKLSHEVVGCVDNKDRWYIDGERWIFGSNPFKYVVECVVNGSSEIAMKKAVACLYESEKGTAILNPGCMKKFDHALVKCDFSKEGDDQSIQFLINHDAEEITEKLALESGFRYC